MNAEEQQRRFGEGKSYNVARFSLNGLCELASMAECRLSIIILEDPCLLGNRQRSSTHMYASSTLPHPSPNASGEEIAACFSAAQAAAACG